MAGDQRDEWGYVVVWEFRVKAGKEEEFELAYGPQGDWVRLFCTDPQYITTDLTCSPDDSRRYLTLDFWTSRRAYDDFRARHQAEYRAIDQQGEQLTESERELGCFERKPG